MEDLISIILPVKNGSNYLRDAIDGIKKQNMNVEVIVVDDASTDNTVELAESCGCKVIRHERNLGQVAGKNSGLKYAQGKYILFHDHDDVLTNGALRKMSDEFDKDKSLGAVIAKVKDFVSADAKNQNQTIKTEPYWGCLGGCILIKKDVFDKIGLFDETLSAGEVISLNAKFQEYNIKIKKIDFVTSNRRIHDTNYGKTHQQKEYKDYASILRARLKK